MNNLEPHMIASNTLTGTAQSWAQQARNAIASLRSHHEKAEKVAADIAANKDLRRDAVGRRQAGLRATVGLAAAQHLSEATAILYRGTAEVARRSLPQVPSDSGQALLQRANVEQMCALPENELAELLRTDGAARKMLFAGATQIELARLRSNPLVDINELQATTLREHNPQAAAAVDDARAAQRELLAVAGRAIAAGVTSEPLPLVGLPPITASQSAVDSAHRYRALGSEWDAESDPIFLADTSRLASIAMAAADKGVA